VVAARSRKEDFVMAMAGRLGFYIKKIFFTMGGTVYREL